MTTVTASVDGMTCGHCMNWVQEALKKIDGVQDAKVNLDNQNAVIKYDEGKVTEHMLAEAVKEAGYKVIAFE
ncbi:MAG TPA: copper ion binding protein [Nitrospinota bacterium]|nr:copper ion binding protein [Nitrospinota bacterium]|tara:strand:- start:81798 stop:82013 length:216 start_codon:yes stop_codon:yes gene_type:complete